MRRAGADGRLDRQHQGRAGHRREGRARSDRARTARSRRCSRTPARSSNKRYREGLLAHADDARQSRELARIRTDVPVAFDRRGAPLPRRRRASGASRCSRGWGSARWSWSTRRRAGHVGKDYAVDRTVEDASRALVEELTAAGRFAPEGAARRAVGGARGDRRHRVLDRRRRARYMPLACEPAAAADLFGPAGDSASTAARSSWRTTLALLGPLLEDPAIEKIGHDLKFDAIVLGRHGVALRRTRDRHDARELPARCDPIEPGARGARARARRLQGAHRRRRLRQGRQGDPVPQSRRSRAALDYAGERADLALQLAADARAVCSSRTELDGAVSRARAAAGPGARRDRARRHARRRRRAGGAGAARRSGAARLRSAQIFELAGEEFNINSPKQLSRDPVREAAAAGAQAHGKTKAASTAVEVLEELALSRTICRGSSSTGARLQKLKGTYIDALPQLVNPETGRVHTCFNQAVAATGRLSSSDPNLQNIPIRTELGREIRARVRRRAGSRADLGRLLADRAARAGAPVRRRGADRGVPARRGHSRSHRAEGVRRPTAGSIPHELRRRAKIINYALLYGKTAFTLAKDIGVIAAGGAGVHRRLLRRLPRGARLHRQTLDDARARPAS